MLERCGAGVAAGLMIGGLILPGHAMCQAAVLACTASADGHSYVALGAEVFALPGVQMLTPAPQPESVLIGGVDFGKSHEQPVNKALLPIAAPDPTQKEGCPQNPAPRVSITVDPWHGFVLSPPVRPSFDPRDRLSMTLSGAGGTFPGMIEVSTHTEPGFRVRENRYLAIQAHFCASPAGQAQLHFNKNACFYRPMDEPTHGWVGHYPPMRVDGSSDAEALHFICGLNRTDPALTTCTVSYRMKPQLDLVLTWIDVSYDVTISPQSPAALIDQVAAYDTAVRSSLAAAEIKDYPWPAASLARWKAAQPTAEMFGRIGARIGASAH